MKWQDTSYAQNVPIKQDQIWVAELEKNQPELKQRVVRAVSQWNNTVRDLIRNETGLRLNIGSGGTTSAQIKVVDGISQPLADVLYQYREYAKFLLHEPLLQTTANGLGFVLDNYDELYKLVPDNSYGQEAHEEEVIEFKLEWLQEILKKLQGQGFKQALMQIPEDTLGAYFFRRNRIEIYWVAIGIYAAKLGVSVEGLTLVVLAHELAHAYTHLGKDIDGIEWDTESFARTDLHIVEGLAQFYTRVICRKLAHRIPSALQAFEVLLESQSSAYCDFQTWAEKSRHQGEIVRFSMIQCRTVGMVDYSEFWDTLNTNTVK